jgi:hypothetical protein
MAKETYYYDGDSKSDSDSVIIIGSPDKQTAYSTKDGSIVRQYPEYLIEMLRQAPLPTSPKQKTKEKQTTSKTPSIDIPKQLDNHETLPHIAAEREIFLEYGVDVDLGRIEITTVGSIIESAL